MTEIGTVGFYEALATALDDDANWYNVGKPLDYSMIHDYSAPIDAAFLLRFQQGKLTEVREVSSDSTNAEFVLTGTPDTWKKIFSKVPGTRASFMHFALSTGALRFTGPFLTTYAQQVKPWEYLLDIVALKVMGDR